MMEFVPSTLGIGLVEGYNSMHFDISLIKPFLRKQVLPCGVLIADGGHDEGHL
jgi:hypothetical protein